MSGYEERYEILRELGRGGMGVVYLARDRELDRNVALKVLLPERSRDERFLSRFRREAKLVKELSHEYVARLLDYDLEATEPYLAFNHVEGARALSDVMATEGRLEREFRLPGPSQGSGPLVGHASLEAGFARNYPEMVLALKISRGLAHIHERGLVHRDLKPANILVGTDGNPCIIDLGMARPLNSTDTALTAAGQIVGTFAYMAPEQMLAEEVDARADVYSFGLIAYELALKRPVFNPKVPDGIGPSSRLGGKIPLLIEIEGSFPKKLAHLIHRCLSVDRASRPGSGEELEELLQAAIRDTQSRCATVWHVPDNIEELTGRPAAPTRARPKAGDGRESSPSSSRALIDPARRQQ